MENGVGMEGIPVYVCYPLNTNSSEQVDRSDSF